MTWARKIFLTCIGLFFIFFNFSSAEEFVSSNFKVLDPTMTPVAFSSSTGFQLFGAISQISIGTSTITSFNLNSGFLYYPFVSTPVVSVTSGNGQASLSWTASEGLLGWNVSGYNVGQATVSGGPYSYTSVGNVTSKTVTSLTNGTTYYFVVRPQDSDTPSNSIATSTEVSVTPTAPASSSAPSGGGGGGGGGGGYVAPATSVIFSGRAYPKSTVTILKDAQIAATTIAGTDANFTTTLSGLTSGNYIFSVYSEDNRGNRSSLLTFPVSVTSGATTNISGIFVAPTIAIDKSEVKRGESITIFGQSVSRADITIAVNSHEEFFARTIADVDGIYLYNFDTFLLELGMHFAKAKASIGNTVSSFSGATGFKVGTKTVIAEEPKKAPEKGDLNGDKKVNIVDFSITAYWYNRPSPPSSIDLNKDGKINLVDFSILAFYWTG